MNPWILACISAFAAGVSVGAVAVLAGTLLAQ